MVSTQGLAQGSPCRRKANRELGSVPPKTLNNTLPILFFSYALHTQSKIHKQLSYANKHKIRLYFLTPKKPDIN